jgi:hypothetical protein
VRQKADRAKRELAQRDSFKLFTSDHEHYRGRQVELDLLVPIVSGKATFRSVLIRQGVNTKALAELAERPLVEETTMEFGIPWTDMIGKMQAEGDQATAHFQIGSLFAADMMFKK